MRLAAVLGISAMNALDQVVDLSRPRWDGNRVLFEIADGDERIPCAISRAALQDLSQRRHYKAAELLLCFVNARAHIEAIALGKLRARSGGLLGPLSIWADDINDLPLDNAPAQSAVGSHRGEGRPTSRSARRKNEK
jgi:Protein of unknown function (DUF1488)